MGVANRILLTSYLKAKKERDLRRRRGNGTKVSSPQRCYALVGFCAYNEAIELPQNLDRGDIFTSTCGGGSAKSQQRASFPVRSAKAQETKKKQLQVAHAKIGQLGVNTIF